MEDEIGQYIRLKYHARTGSAPLRPFTPATEYQHRDDRSFIADITTAIFFAVADAVTLVTRDRSNDRA